MINVVATRTSIRTGNPTNGRDSCGNRKKREHENTQKRKKEKVAVGLAAARENLETSATHLTRRAI